MTLALVSGLLSFLIVPLFIAENSSGTLTNIQAAGQEAEFVELNGLNVHIERHAYQGDCKCEPPVLVLMHGFGASTFSWRNVGESLSVFGDVIAYDRPGFGFTDRPLTWGKVNPYSFQGNFELLEVLLDNFANGRQVVLVGHSAGGQLAAEFARLNPKKVSSLVLVDPSILTTGGGPDGFEWFFQLPQMQKLGPLLVSSIATSGDDLLRKSHFDETKITKDVYDGYHQPLKIRGWERAFWNFASAPRKNDLASNLSSITMPTLLISGVADTVVPTADTRKLEGLMPNAKIEIIQASGHLPQEEQPEAFLAVIAKHWAELVSN